MNKIFIFFLMVMFFTVSATAMESFKVNTTAPLIVVCINNGFCSSAAQCNISVVGPEGQNVVPLGVMTNQDSYHNYTLTPTEIQYIGTYSVGGFCKDGASLKEIDYLFEVNLNGLETSWKDVILPIILVLLSAILLIMGFMFSDNHWIQKSMFIFFAMGAGLLAINSAKQIVALNENLISMSNAGILIFITLMSIYIVYILIYAFKEIISIFEKKGDIKWGNEDAPK